MNTEEDDDRLKKRLNKVLETRLDTDKVNNNLSYTSSVKFLFL